jgi:hypothetical protein
MAKFLFKKRKNSSTKFYGFNVIRESKTGRLAYLDWDQDGETNPSP